MKKKKKKKEENRNRCASWCCKGKVSREQIEERKGPCFCTVRVSVTKVASALGRVCMRIVGRWRGGNTPTATLP